MDEKEKSEETPIEEKKKGIDKKGWIVIGSFAFVAALLISVSVVGAFAVDIASSNKSSKTYLNWATTSPGFYDESKKLLLKDDKTLAGTFALSDEKDVDGNKYYSIESIEAPENGVYLVMPSSYSDITIKATSKKSEAKNVFTNDDSSKSIKEIYFKSFYSSIGEGSFRYLPSLTKISFATDLSYRQSLADYSLADNPLLEKIEFASSLGELGKGVLYNDSAIKTLDFSKTSLTKIGESAFENCLSLSSLSLPSTITYIGADFLSNSPLTSIEYSGTSSQFSAISIDENAFHSSSVTSIKCADKVIDI